MSTKLKPSVTTQYKKCVPHYDLHNRDIGVKKEPFTRATGESAMKMACVILEKAKIKYNEQKKKRKIKKKLALVLDIDECSIMNTADPDVTCPNPYVKPVYDYALELGYKIFFVTARGASNTKHKSLTRDTRNTLLQAGYKKHEIYFQSGDWYDKTKEKYKSAMRQDLSEKNIIVLTVGDKLSDLSLFKDNITILLEDKLTNNDKEVDHQYIFLKGYDRYSIWGWKLPNTEY